MAPPMLDRAHSHTNYRSSVPNDLVAEEDYDALPSVRDNTLSLKQQQQWTYGQTMQTSVWGQDANLFASINNESDALPSVMARHVTMSSFVSPYTNEKTMGVIREVSMGSDHKCGAITESDGEEGAI